MSKILLSFEEDYDFILIGISCHTKDYRLCWEINKALNTDLIRAENLEISKKNKTNSFSFYEFIDEDNYLEYYLISNRGNDGYLIAEQKKVDFFLLLKGNTSLNQIQDIICKINSLSLVLTSFKIDPNQLKSKQNLLF
ncbi:MAG: IPExxxVDY family protein [Flavobacteriales bacterium]|nr:IPExxxVDY family protein [Flavobacteriales bacterium]